ncbi:MAG: glycosyl hydrolase-related protein, partial [bacterium]|nr:glycosyl hydrolase-related protein [bacterium]
FVAKDLPPAGYATYYLVPHVPEASQLMNIQAPGMMVPEFPEPEFVLEDVEDRISEPYRGVRVGRRFQTAALDVEVDEVTGRVTVRNRRLNRVLAEGIHLVGLEESMRAGPDAYAYTGRQFEMSVDRVDLEESGEVRATLRLDGHLLSSPFQIRYRFYGALDRMDVEVDLDWRDEKPVRVQMVFQMGEGMVHYGVPYGFEAYDASQAEGQTQRVCQGWVAVDVGEGGCVLAGNRRSFEFKNGEVRSDILRSCLDPASYSYKRIWRSYPDVLSCRYSLRGYDGSLKEGLAHQDGWALNQPFQAHVVYDREARKPLPDRMSFVRLEGKGLVTTALKAAEDGRGYVVRAYEALGQSCTARLETFGEVLQFAQEVDLLEHPRGEVDPSSIVFAPFEIKTLRFELEKAQ